MARRRFQDPKPERRGDWWTLRYWQDETANGRTVRKRIRIKLAPASIGEREVRKIAAEVLRPFNQGLLLSGSATTFKEYVTNVYIPTVLPTMAQSTRSRYQGIIDKYLIPTFGPASLRNIGNRAVQGFLSGMAGSPLSYESRDKMRDVLSSILGSAVRFEFLVRNPVEGLRLPPGGAGKRSKPYISPQQLAALVELMPEPYATMVYVAVYSGLRVSELIALRWSDIHEDSITVDERCCRGDWGETKTEASHATIAVPRSVIERIHRLKTMTVEVKAGRAVRCYPAVKSDGRDDLVFQSVKEGRPMRDNNVLARYIKPAGRRLNIGWVNWQVLRRSFATWLKMAGADVKDAQALMRHSRASTTLDIYQQFVPESQRRVVERLGSLVN